MKHLWIIYAVLTVAVVFVFYPSRCMQIDLLSSAGEALAFFAGGALVYIIFGSAFAGIWWLINRKDGIPWDAARWLNAIFLSGLMVALVVEVVQVPSLIVFKGLKDRSDWIRRCRRSSPPQRSSTLAGKLPTFTGGTKRAQAPFQNAVCVNPCSHH